MIGLKAAIQPLDSLANVDTTDSAWVRFVPSPSAMSMALRRERGSRARATAAHQDLTVAQLEQTVAYAGEKSRAMFDICKRTMLAYHYFEKKWYIYAYCQHFDKNDFL